TQMACQVRGILFRPVIQPQIQRLFGCKAKPVVTLMSDRVNSGSASAIERSWWSYGFRRYFVGGRKLSGNDGTPGGNLFANRAPRRLKWRHDPEAPTDDQDTTANNGRFRGVMCKRGKLVCR